MGVSSSRRRSNTQGSSLPDRAPRSHPPLSSPKSEKSRSRGFFQSTIDERNIAPKKLLDSDSPDDASECPICFLNFEELNMVTCCKQMICSECYLLVKKTAARENTNCPCPFCSISNLTVVYTPQLMSKKISDTSIPSSNMSKIDISEGKSSGIGSSTFSSPSPSPTCHSTPSTNGSTSSRGIKKEMNVPLCSITDRNDIEKEIQGMRLRYSDDQPPPIPRSSSRSNHSRGGEYNDLSRTFARRNYLSSASDYNTSRGTMNDLEHAALRLRFAVAIGERSHDIFRHPNEGMERGRDRDNNSMAEYLESRVVGRRSHNDLERIEEMMMMEAIRQSMAETPANIRANSSNISEEISMTNSTKSGRTSEETTEETFPKTSKVSACSSLLSNNDSHLSDNSPNDQNNGHVKGFDNIANICDVDRLTTDRLSTVKNLHGNLSDSESDVGDSSGSNSEQTNSEQPEIDEENEMRGRCATTDDGLKMESVDDEISTGTVVGNKDVNVDGGCDLEGLKSDNSNGESLLFDPHLSVSDVEQSPLAGYDNPIDADGDDKHTEADGHPLGADGSPSLELLRKIEIALGKSAVGNK